MTHRVSIVNMICVADMFSVAHMSEKAERLREAREKSGYKSAAAAADALGMKASTYRAHENGQNDFDFREAMFYARKFGVDPIWLYSGREQSSDLKKARDLMVGRGEIDFYKDLTPEIETRAGAGGGGVHISPTDEQPLQVGKDAIRTYWQIPESYLSELKMRRPSAYIIEVTGDSMYDPAYPGAPGSIFPGDRLIIDISDRKPSPPGPFAVWDGLGVVVKMVEVIPNTDPVRIRMHSRNPRYSAYDATEDEAVIIGRVRAKISIL